ncbi:MAG TPA: Asd/ArgC dimerization domain-containing protein, partial [Pirellulaceae bacterium]
VFTPHLIPMDRGILATCYARRRGTASEADLLETLRQFYQREPFVRVVDHLPATKDTLGSNFCDVTVRVVGDRIVTISCLDNLVKGASGAAVQNMNLMLGLPETLGLE